MGFVPFTWAIHFSKKDTYCSVFLKGCLEKSMITSSWRCLQRAYLGPFWARLVGKASGVLIQIEALQGFRELWEDSFDSVSQHRERVSAHAFDAYPKIEARNFEVKGTCGHQQICSCCQTHHGLARQNSNARRQLLPKWPQEPRKFQTPAMSFGGTLEKWCPRYFAHPRLSQSRGAIGPRNQ